MTGGLLCPGCGASVPPGAFACPSCGRVLTPEPGNPFEAPTAPLGEAPLSAARLAGRIVRDIVSGLLVAAATLTAFVATCLPLGVMGASANNSAGVAFGFLVGGVAAFFAFRGSLKLFRLVTGRAKREKGDS